MIRFDSHHDDEGNFIPHSDFVFLARKLYPLLKAAQENPDKRFYATKIPTFTANQFVDEWHKEYRVILMKGDEFIRVASGWENEAPSPLRKGEKIQTRCYILGHELVPCIQKELQSRLEKLNKKDFVPLLHFMQN